MPPGIPWIVRLRLTGNKAPIDSPDLVPLCKRKHRIERTSHTARHVFRADQRTIELLQEHHFFLKAFRQLVVVETDHIGIFQLNPLDFAQWAAFFKIDVPKSAGEWLRRIRLLGRKKLWAITL